MMQEATVFNVEKFFGWVAKAEDFVKAFGMRELGCGAGFSRKGMM